MSESDRGEFVLQAFAESRQSCRICLDRDPGLIRNGSEFDFDPPIVSFWSQWLGNVKPIILIVGQDFGSVGYFVEFQGKDDPRSPTNNNLYKLLAEAGVRVGRPPFFDRVAPVFLTNAILCLKAGPMNAPIKDRWVRACSQSHLKPLINALQPKIVVGMGSHGWQAVRNALSMSEAPSMIGQAAGLSWTLSDALRVFAVGHCSGLGLVNRSWTQQVLDWQAIGQALPV